MSAEQRAAMLALIQERHEGQFRNGTEMTPYWEHPYSAGKIIDDAIDLAAPDMDPERRDVLYLSTLGHDLYEDTDTTPEEIAATFGEPVADIIGEVSNAVSDEDRDAYKLKLRGASDDATLVKLGDVIQNSESVHEHKDALAEALGEGWVDDFYLPIARETMAIVNSHEFSPGDTALAGVLLARADRAMQALEAGRPTN